MADGPAGRLQRLRGRIRPYAWGGRGYIAELVGLDEIDGPVAEYWLGAHPDAPARLADGRPLDRAVTADPGRWSGGGDWPFLFKLLDVAEPLSIQVHPDAAQARAGFDREDALAIPRDAPDRSFRDPSAKPELAVALTPFHLLFGFAADDEIARRLAPWPSLRDLADQVAAGGALAAFETVLRAGDDRLARWLVPVFEAVRGAGGEDPLTPSCWLARWVGDAPAHERLDRGALGFLLMNILELAPGEGIFQGPGVPHAYLRGQIVELMASSDNVLRCGLTPKHVDPEAVLAHLAPDVRTPTLVSPVPRGPGHQDYPCPVDDFLLSRLELGPGESINVNPHGPLILFTLQGTVTASDADASLTLARGEAAVRGISTAPVSLQAAEAAELFMATRPTA